MKKFIITEDEKRSIRQMYGLNEQETNRNLPTIQFEETFPMNMVKIHDQSLLTNKMNELEQVIRNTIGQGIETLRSISITINSGHSPESATNGLPRGINEPDHDYEGLLTMSVCESGQNERCWLPFSRNNERTRVEGGNRILAKLRAENLKNYLQEYIEQHYPDAEITINVGEIDPTRRFVNAVINGVVKGRLEEPTPKPKGPFITQFRAFKTKYVGQDPSDKGSGSYGSGDFYWYTDKFGKTRNITKDNFDQYKANGVEEVKYEDAFPNGPLLRTGSRTGAGPIPGTRDSQGRLD